MGLTTDQLSGWIRGFAAAVAEHADELTALDSAIGDADHGTNLVRGTTAALERIEGASGPRALLKAVGMTFISKVGGASGSLYGSFFLEAAKASPEEGELSDVAAALRAGLASIVARGHAEAGDKTMIDALEPAVAALEGGASLADAASAAEAGRDATEPLVARKGRASYLGERSAGHVDPGAASAALLVRALAEAAA
ncbi:dihydroxyacetone kinase subunit DhaL [Microbacterium indicum]|uniref:dihydroxyacetone kinase subunit DhaL n=1 Tax=Microbacterium indicum TaxID=358100 RepID=UPI00048C18D6|nr:dihydroxyacetone kinase subunit DhaL [Microbacterium indicum]